MHSCILLTETSGAVRSVRFNRRKWYHLNSLLDAQNYCPQTAAVAHLVCRCPVDPCRSDAIRTPVSAATFHPKVYGASVSPAEVIVVSEFVEGGTLRELLHNRRKHKQLRTRY